MDDLKWFAAVLLVIGLLWISGQSRNASRAADISTTTPKAAVTPAQKAPTGKAPTGGSQTGTKPVTKPTNTVQTLPKSPAGAVNTSGTENTGSLIVTPPLRQDISPLIGKLSIMGVHRSTRANEEYVTIQASSRNTSDIVITGLRVQSAVSLSGQNIGKGWALPFPNSQGEGDLVVLRPGVRAYIVTGRSPNGMSFQQNTCTGYFEKGMNFFPTLHIQCPRPIDEPLPIFPNHLSDTCLDYIQKLSKCSVPPATVPANLKSDGSCQAFIFNRINYNQCVVDHKGDAGFFRGEWHLYLGRSAPMWREKRELIELVDGDGKIIDDYHY